MSNKDELRTIVFDGLTAATENEYDMSQHSDDEIAGDMIAYDYSTEMFFAGREDLEAMKAEMLPHIHEWRSLHK